ncbi:DUF6318 family protein [Arthrobacter sp. efr-133-TYG-120]|uniref:DUF6318 family protein n=1 Tax=Arthrobacter sp. efr-133-TYG-120 TaxID=3040280 RepID=UPI00254A4918|nr:DUF6318 family protein [Arthrobacter sp. efr-133-TYG-120]
MTPRTSVSARFFMIVSLGTALTLTACGISTQPQSASPTVSASASASVTGAPSPTSTAVYKPADAKGKAENVPVPVLPEAAKANTKEGVEAFARYWYDLMNFAYETGDLKPVNTVTGSGCASCSRVRPTVEEWNSGGKWIEGGKLSIVAADTKFTPDTGGNYQVIIQYHRQAISYHRSDGSVEQSSPKTSLQADIMIANFNNGAWTASNVDRIGG